MFGIGWVEISMIMTLVVFALTIYSLLMKQGQNQERAAVRPAPTAGPNFGPGVRLHFLIVFILFVVLVFSPPLAWAILGQAGMPLVRLATILLLLVSLYAIIAVAIFVAQRLATAAPGPVSDFPQGEASQPQVDLIARITQRFCPRCS
jgi:Na+/alanine symporter